MRLDGSSYTEHAQSAINLLIAQDNLIEGVGPRSGRIDRLRMLVTDEDAAREIAAPLPPIPISSDPRNDIGVIAQRISRADADGMTVFSARVFAFKRVHKLCSECGRGLHPSEAEFGATCGPCRRDARKRVA